MIRALLDTNVVLDVLLARRPWLADSAAVWQAHQDGRIVLYLAATTLTNIFYIVRRNSDLQRAAAAVNICLATFEVSAVDRVVLASAAARAGTDFEDNVQIACAVQDGLGMIVTRDPTGFRNSPIPVRTPAQLLAQLAST